MCLICQGYFTPYIIALRYLRTYFHVEMLKIAFQKQNFAFETTNNNACRYILQNYNLLITDSQLSKYYNTIIHVVKNSETHDSDKRL